MDDDAEGAPQPKPAKKEDDIPDPPGVITTHRKKFVTNKVEIYKRDPSVSRRKHKSRILRKPPSSDEE